MTEKPTYKELEERIRDLELSESEHTKTEKTLMASEERFRMFFDQGLIGMTMTSLEKGWLDANDVLCSMLGYSRNELFKMKWPDLTHPDDLEPDLIQFRRLLAGEINNYSMEKRFIRSDGNIIFTAVSINAIHKPDDNSVDYILALVEDITECKQANEDKIKAQKIAADQKKLAFVGQIAGKMAHDFNNILSAIMGNTELSLVDCKDAETKKTLELIFEQTIRGKNLTKNLTAFAKDQEPKREYFRVDEKIDLVFNLLKKDLAGIEVIREQGVDVQDLFADPGMIEHGLVNLIQNSIHALSKIENPRILTRTYCLCDNICIEIEDNGCGIPKEQIKNIYELSFTLKGSKDVAGSYKSDIEGTGYGMANVKKYIELHKGSIRVESELDTGTTIIITLPIINTKSSNIEKVEIQKGKVHHGKHVLLVEDEIIISDVQYRSLIQESCDNKVDIANSGQAAMEMFDRSEYDLVSLDYVLSENINGMDVYNHIRRTNKTIPILFVSGNIEFLESLKKLKQKDSNIDHLSKPCQCEIYLKSINSMIEKSLAATGYPTRL